MNLIWAAGILEGEGSFLLRRNSAPRITCGMTDLDVIEKLQEIFGGAIYKQGYKREDYFKDVWIWAIEGAKAADVMRQLYPYMMSRRKSKIEEVLRGYQAWRISKKEKADGQRKNGMSAAQEYLTTEKSLRIVAEEFGISYVTVKNYVDLLKAA